MGGFRASDADRERYVEVIETAYVDGQLGDQDRELRVTRALTAETLDELDILTRDLQNHPAPVVVRPAPAPTVVEAAPAAPPPKSAAYPTVPPGSDRGRKIVGYALVGVIGLVALAVTYPAQDRVDSIYGEDDYYSSVPWDEVDVAPDPSFAMKPRAIRAMVDAYQAEFGTLEAHEVVLYPRRVSVLVPADADRPTPERWFWDGAWSQVVESVPPVDSRPVVDLGSIDAGRLVENIRTAKGAVRVDDGRFARAVLARRGEDVLLEIVVSNPFHESGSLITTPDGDIVRREPFQR